MRRLSTSAISFYVEMDKALFQLDIPHLAAGSFIAMSFPVTNWTFGLYDLFEAVGIKHSQMRRYIFRNCN